MKATVIKNFERPSSEWIEKYRDIPTSVIADCLQRYYGMSGELRPIFDGIKFCGPALTIQSMAGNNLMSHLAMTFAQEGDVLVVDARGYLGNAVWGGVQATYAVKRGIAGLVVDGAIRDVAEMRASRFPVFCRGRTPNGPHKGWADSINLPIQCGGVPVNAGDLILGDDDGVVVVSANRIESIYKEALLKIETEKKWIQDINNGLSTLEAVGLKKIVDGMEIDYE